MSQSTFQPLVDVQNYQDHRGIAIDQVGVSRVELPLSIIQQDGRSQVVHARVSMSVGLSKEYKGTHLSRFIIQLTEWSQNHAFTHNLEDFLQEALERLNTQSAYIQIEFKYFVDKLSPVTQLPAPMAYACEFDAAIVNQNYRFALGIEVPIATLCPCSKEISDYGAHNQRALIRTKLNLDTRSDYPQVWLEDLVKQLDECASCPVYPILKRADEKYVTERAYDNPKFVEDVIRDATYALSQFQGIRSFDLEVEALESIHGHNAWAKQSVHLI